VTAALRPARPTLRCLREDLCLPVPPVDRPLDEITHPLLRKATERFIDPGPTSGSATSSTVAQDPDTGQGKLVAIMTVTHDKPSG
jgi:hypothetical protein